MDKSKLIEEILNEWGMRSEDGLVGGYDTPGNIAILAEILKEKKILKPVAKAVGVPSDALRDEYYTIDANGKKVANKKNPYYQPGADFVQVKSGLASMSKDGIWLNLEDKLDGKGIPAAYAKLIMDSVKNHGGDTKPSFLSFYNSCDLDKALEVFKDPKYAAVITAIEQGKKNAMGRGELTFVFLLKGAKSGGAAKVDILFVEGLGDVEVKEVGAKENKIAISQPTFAGWHTGFVNTAIDELATEIRKDKNFGLYLLNEVLIDKEKKYPAQERSGNKISYVTPEQIEYFGKFVTETRTGEMGGAVFNALDWIWQKLLSPFPGETAIKTEDIIAEKVSPGMAKVSISLGNSTKEFKIDPTEAAAAIRSVKSGARLTLNIGDKLEASDRTNEEYYYLAKSLKYFKEKITRKKISSFVNDLAKNKYSGYLIIYGDENKKYSAEYKSIDRGLLEFSSLGFNKIHCFFKNGVVKEPSEKETAKKDKK